VWRGGLEADTAAHGGVWDVLFVNLLRVVREVLAAVVA
jgi:hypothetical protein